MHTQVNTRYWGFRNATEGADPAKPEVTLCPLLDMADHAEVLHSSASASQQWVSDSEPHGGTRRLQKDLQLADMGMTLLQPKQTHQTAQAMARSIAGHRRELTDMFVCKCSTFSCSCATRLM